MNANELMLGDLVTFKECLEDGDRIITIKICEIHSYNNDVLVEIDGDKTCDIIELDDNIVGIPLTPEILEKNGFVWNELPFVQSWEQYGLSIYGTQGNYRINCGQNISMNVSYVHTFQHALRLCGIEKEIVL